MVKLKSYHFDIALYKSSEDPEETLNCQGVSSHVRGPGCERNRTECLKKCVRLPSRIKGGLYPLQVSSIHEPARRVFSNILMHVA